MRLREITEAVGTIPTRSFKKLWHVGTLNASDKRNDSHEGAGLSVSLHPEEWRRIARGMVSGDLWLCTKPGNRFLDAHALSAAALQSVAEWGVQNNLARRTTLWRVRWYDDELDQDMVMVFDDPEAAKDEADGVNGEIEEFEGGWVGTPMLAFKNRVERIDPVMVPDLLLPLYAESLGFDGVWWQDRLDPANYSAPRGVIVPDMIQTWRFERTSDDI